LHFLIIVINSFSRTKEVKNVRPNSKIGGTLVVILLLLAFYFGSLGGFLKGSSEFSIGKPYSQSNPAIYEDKIVWQGYIGGRYDIYGCRFSTNREYHIQNNPNSQWNPAISEDIVVWQENREGNWNIYGYDLVSSNPIQIVEKQGDQSNPAIYGDIVVWEDHRGSDSDIYYFDREKQSDYPITTSQEDQRKPAIYGDIIVWQDSRNGNWDIYGYDFSRPEGDREFPIATRERDQTNPAIYGTIVVWEEEITKHNTDIYFKDLSLGKEAVNITRDPAKQKNPAIYGDIVVWQDNRNKTVEWDIYGYNLVKEDEFCISNSQGNQSNPSIYKDIVVWQDEKVGNFNINYCRISAGESEITTASGNQSDSAIHKKIVVWQDFRKGDWDIYGYNLSTEEEFQITTDTNDQTNPAIYGTIVVWEEKTTQNNTSMGDEEITKHNTDIYFKDLSPGKEAVNITRDPAIQKNPAIYGDIIVWQDSRNGNWDIYGYDFSRPEGDREFPIATGERNQTNPAIYGTIVVWEEEITENSGKEDNGDEKVNSDVFGYDFSRPEGEREFPIATGEGNQYDPAIYEDIVVWTDTRNDDGDIYGRYLSELEDRKITEENIQTNPAIYGTIVVWEEEINNHWDICYFDFPMGQVNRITNDTMNQREPGIYENVVVWTDNRNEDNRNGFDNEDIYCYIIPHTPSLFYAIPIIVAILAVVLMLRMKTEPEIEKPIGKPKPHVLICPQCKNRIKEDWDTCPYCEAKLK